MTDSSNQLLTAWRDKFQQDVECVREYLSKCPYAEYTQIDDVYDDGDVYVLTVGMAVRKDELTKIEDKKMPDDVEILLDFILDYGGKGLLPNMDEGGSGDIAYEAALRLKMVYQLNGDEA